MAATTPAVARARRRARHGYGQGKATVRRLNDELRAIAATLSERRDAVVSVETVDALHERFPGRVPAGTF